MQLLWPGSLFLLGIIPLIIVGYIWILRRRKRFAIRYSSLSIVREAIPRRSRFRRHIPFTLFVLALASLLVALSRPVTIISVPTDQTTIILAIDVSGSMRSRDIQPSRLAAAEAAALSFVQRQKSTTQIGLVAFSTFSELIQQPTTDQEALQSAIESLILGQRTAIGNGILTSLQAISEIDKNIPPPVMDPTTGTEPAPVPHGAYAPDIIVLLTDGASNTGIDPLVAAKEAADRGVRIYTIGFGTASGYIPFGGQGIPGGNPFGGNQGFGGNGFGRGFRTPIDETTLKQIASMTGGAYYTATSANELQSVFNSLPTYLITKHEVSEVSVLFVAAGALLAILAITLSLLWHPLP
ncbi:MAG: VWA domain-containing protein [Chloroflexi bacterium]|nr:VWA domain-containing protein [Chloroflexota bacterium]